MDIEGGKRYLTLTDLRQHSIWKYSDIDDLIHPIFCAEDFPEAQYDLLIRANFIVSAGIELVGYVVGVKNIFSIAIAFEETKFSFNRNLPEYYAESLHSVSKFIDRELTMKDFSPLKYTTDIDLQGFRNISGEFDLLKKRTIEEQMDGL